MVKTCIRTDNQKNFFANSCFDRIRYLNELRNEMLHLQEVLFKYICLKN